MKETRFNRNEIMTRLVARIASVGTVALLAAGCAVGPNYKRPAVSVPTNFRNAPAEVSTNSLADLQWWEVYQDATLSALIRTALTNNYDLRIAIARVEPSRAIAAQAKSQFVPKVGYQGVTNLYPAFDEASH